MIDRVADVSTEFRDYKRPESPLPHAIQIEEAMEEMCKKSRKRVADLQMELCKAEEQYDEYVRLKEWAKRQREHLESDTIP